MISQPFDNAMPGSLSVHLGNDRALALASYITKKAGTLEVPITWEMPEMILLPDCRAYLGGDFREGGAGWPERYVLWLSR